MKILKILFKEIHIIIFILILLVLQAMCDLKLPEYTSNIVNVGIQQGGIEDSVYEAISEEEMNNILLFVNDEEKEKVLDSYTLLNKDNLSDADYEKYLENYLVLANENVYELKDITDEQRNELNDILSPAVFTTSVLEGDSKEIEELKTKLNTTNIFVALRNMPEENFNEITSEITKQTKDIEESIVTGMNVVKIEKDYEQLGINTDDIQTSYIINTGIKMILIAFAAMIIMIVIAYLASRVGAKFSRDLRSKVVHKVMDYGEAELKEFSTASLITRSTNDIQQVQMLIIILLRMVLYAPIIGIGAFVKISGNEMGYVIGIAVLAIVLIVGTLFGIALPKFKILQKLVDKLNLVSREILTGLPVIRAFSNEKHEEERFDKANVDLTKANLFVNRVMTIMMPSMMFVMNGISVLIIWVGADKIDNGVMQVGTLLAFITYTMQIIMAFLMLSMISIILPRALVSAKRISEVLNKDVIVKDSKNPKEFKNIKGKVEFKDVYFRYPDAEEDVLQNISFTATPGTTTAFIGSTGAGKSTIINLIPRFFDTTGGKILIDDINIKDVSLHDLRDKIGYVPQKGRLFTGTISSNIAFGEEKLTDKEIKEAAQTSEALDFIMEKPDKFDTPISEGGTNVSGGQKQRLAIARAIAKKPQILIFDDSFSALDYKTDKKLRVGLNKKLKKSTIFIVAQRISTIMHADKIVVIEDGKVAGIGNHKTLMKDCPVYKEIALSQLSKEELDYEK